MRPDLQAEVRQFFDALIWDDLKRADAAVASVLTTEAADLPSALRQAMGDWAPTADWNQLGFLLADIKTVAAERDIPGELHDVDEDSFDLDEPDDFFATVQRLLVDEGYDIWSWETGEDTFCAVIARTDDRHILEQVARKLGLTESNDAALRCGAYL